jgi:hypothetical protein
MSVVQNMLHVLSLMGIGTVNPQKCLTENSTKLDFLNKKIGFMYATGV